MEKLLAKADRTEYAASIRVLPDPPVTSLDHDFRKDVADFMDFLAFERVDVPDKIREYSIALESPKSGNCEFWPSKKTAFVPRCFYVSMKNIESYIDGLLAFSFSEEVAHILVDATLGSPALPSDWESEVSFREFLALTEMFGRACFTRYMTRRMPQLSEYGESILIDFSSERCANRMDQIDNELYQKSSKFLGYLVGYTLGDNFAFSDRRLGGLFERVKDAPHRDVLKWVAKETEHVVDSNFPLTAEKVDEYIELRLD